MKKQKTEAATPMMMEILKDPEKAKSRFAAASRLASDLMRLVASENEQAIIQLADNMEYEPEQLRDDIIDLYEFLGHPALS